MIWQSLNLNHLIILDKNLQGCSTLKALDILTESGRIDNVGAICLPIHYPILLHCSKSNTSS